MHVRQPFDAETNQRFRLAVPKLFARARWTGWQVPSGKNVNNYANVDLICLLAYIIGRNMGVSENGVYPEMAS